MAALRWLGDKIGMPIANAGCVVALVVGVCVGLLVVTFAFAWVGIEVVGFFDHPKHVDPATVEVCWVDNAGPNGLQEVRGPRSDEPPYGRAIEVPCG